jgi:hypothetical protein
MRPLPDTSICRRERGYCIRAHRVCDNQRCVGGSGTSCTAGASGSYVEVKYAIQRRTSRFGKWKTLSTTGSWGEYGHCAN